MNTLNKLLLGASVLGALYLNSCDEVDRHAVVDNTLVKVERDSTSSITSVITGDIKLDTNKISWNNAKLVSKDEGFLSYMRMCCSDQGYSSYMYAKCLFKGPNDTEISLFGKDGTFYVGQNYNIEFYRLKAGQKVSSANILDALELVNPEIPLRVENNRYVDDLDGLLSSYSRVKKSDENLQ